MAIGFRNAAIILLLVAALCNPPDLSSCGPFLPEAIFAFSTRPENAAEDFARGRLGVLQPGYTRFYLVIAYRYLSGTGLNEAERSALFPAPSSPVPATQPVDAVGEWQEARRKIFPAVGARARIDVYKQSTAPDSFVAYVNCGDAAFHTAVATLQDRTQRGV